MRWLFILLLAANIAFGGYVWLREHAPNPDAQLSRLQVNADQVRIIPAPERPAPPPALAPPPASGAAEGPAAAPVPGTCVEWGSFGGGELARAQAAIDRLALGDRVRRVEVAVTAGYWVYIPPQKSRAEMERKAAELKALGVTDYYPVTEANRWRHAISLGIFRSEEGAKKYLALLRGKGVRSAVAGKRDQRVTQSAFLIRSPNEEDSANLVVLKSEFPGSELRALECPSG
jgi:hypothetical protein